MELFAFLHLNKNVSVDKNQLFQEDFYHYQQPNLHKEFSNNHNQTHGENMQLEKDILLKTKSQYNLLFEKNHKRQKNLDNFHKVETLEKLLSHTSFTSDHFKKVLQQLTLKILYKNLKIKQ